MRIQKIFSIIALSILTGCTDFLDVVHHIEGCTSNTLLSISQHLFYY